MLGKVLEKTSRPQPKTWFDDECSELIDLRKRAKLQWLQNPNQINGDKYKIKINQ
jgi:hypothetical protein